jgi:MFS family permease
MSQDKQSEEVDIGTVSSLHTVEKKLYAKPDVGYSWVVVLGSFAVHFATLGVVYIYGVFQQAYQNEEGLKDVSISGIALIGSVSSSALPFFAILSGKLTDKFGHRVMGIIGGVIYAVSLVLASFATKYWQLFITQGLLFGFSVSIAYFPALSIISQWFEKKLGSATGIAVAGAGIGGLFWGPVARLMISTLGRSNTLLIIGLVGGTMIIASSLLFKTRYPPKTSKSSYSKLFKSSTFRLMYLTATVSTFGYYVPFFYVASYGVQVGLSASQGAFLIGLLNGGSAIGRVALGFVSDRIGHLNSLWICVFSSSMTMFLIWPFATNFATLAIFVILYGFAVGGFISLQPTVIVQLFGTENLGGTFGLMYSAAFFGAVGGPPVAGAIVQAYTTVVNNSIIINYVPTIMASGSSMLLGAIILAYIRQSVAKGKLMVKV